MGCFRLLDVRVLYACCRSPCPAPIQLGIAWTPFGETLEDVSLSKTQSEMRAQHFLDRSLAVAPTTAGPAPFVKSKRGIVAEIACFGSPRLSCGATGLHPGDRQTRDSYQMAPAMRIPTPAGSRSPRSRRVAIRIKLGRESSNDAFSLWKPRIANISMNGLAIGMISSNM